MECNDKWWVYPGGNITGSGVWLFERAVPFCSSASSLSAALPVIACHADQGDNFHLADEYSLSIVQCEWDPSVEVWQRAVA